MSKKKLLLLFVLIFTTATYGKLFINEFSASNSGSIVDPDFKSTSDWIELYNAASSEINLKGYYLSDDSAKTTKWQIKNDLMIPAGGYQLIWCDALDTLNTHTNFKLAAEGEYITLSNPQTEILDFIKYGPQESNIAYGRKCDGCDEWVFYTSPSPGTTNTGISYKGLILNVPYFYPAGRIVETGQVVNIKNIFPGIVRYTLDGSEPTESSQIYESPITINTNTVIRASIFNTDSLRPGPVATESYFIKDQVTNELPIVSLASAPENFWDSIKGIYVQDFKPEWEVPVNIELFENDGSDRSAFNSKAGVKVNGLYSWQLPQKMLGVYFRKEYGSGSLDYPVILDQASRSYKNFALRASGNDWSETMFKDGLFQKATQINMDNEYQGYRPAVMYLNGQYMGINNLRQKVDEDFIDNELGLKGGTIDMIENESYVEAGSIDTYAAFENMYLNNFNYDSIKSQMDVQNFMDFMICELFTNNTSTGHNVMAWKPKEGGKWRWILNDFDRGFYDPTTNLSSTYIDKAIYPMAKLMANSEFKTAFGYRLADQLFTTFNLQRYSKLMDDNADLIRAEMPRHIERWAGTTSSYGNPIPSVEHWENKMSDIKTYLAQRGKLLLKEWNSKYALGTAVELSLTSDPLEAGSITMNKVKLPASFVTGVYPQAGNLSLSTEAKPGYNFVGWKIAVDSALIPLQSVWKYYDKSTAPASDWMSNEFVDTSWSSGQAELGYGESDEKTKISYGSSSTNKIISYYFRKEFTINNLDSITSPRISIKADDGAVVYINGKEFERYNIQDGPLSFTTLASRDIPNESLFADFAIDKSYLQNGKNVIAVEVHQSNVTSSDISFELKLLASKVNSPIVSTSKDFNFNLNNNSSIIASYERTNDCLVPSVISGYYKLEKACTNYLTQGDVVIEAGATLEIEPGVEIILAENSNWYVDGKIIAKGTASEPIVFKGATETSKWGAIMLQNSPDTTQMSYCIIKNASHGLDPVKNVAAISAFHAVARFDHLTIKEVYANPIAARYSDIVIRDSYLHSDITGDLINLKYGKGEVYNSEFVGNDKPDTDAIDFDNIEDGIIQGNYIHDLHGSNSDAIDIGEAAKNILIDNNYIYSITDKGVSVGQQSSARIQNSTFINCNLGAGLKDSTQTLIDHNTYFSCVTPIAAYEKNPGSAGGNAMITHNIFSNSYGQMFISDEKSKTKFSNNLADIDTLSVADGNITADPLFTAPNNLDFNLKANSPAILENGNLGSTVKPYTPYLMPVISTISEGDSADFVPEFIIISNLNNFAFDISGYSFTDGIVWTAPEGTTIDAQSRIVLSSNITHEFWSVIKDKLFQWDAGKINNAGEIIQLSTNSGMIIDQVPYKSDHSWPAPFKGVTSLDDLRLDNHFGKNWKSEILGNLFVQVEIIENTDKFRVYPNPAKEYVHIQTTDFSNKIQIFDLPGKLVMERTEIKAENELNISSLNPGIYIIRQGTKSTKLTIQ